MVRFTPVNIFFLDVRLEILASNRTDKVHLIIKDMLQTGTKPE